MERPRKQTHATGGPTKRTRRTGSSSTKRRKDVARTSERRGRAARRGPRLRVPRWVLPLAVLGAVAFLYVRPIATYLDTREQLAERRTEVETLRAERARVTARLERATSLEELARAARRIGYVRPDEHLFIVKGTAAWSRKHSG